MAAKKKIDVIEVGTLLEEVSLELTQYELLDLTLEIPESDEYKEIFDLVCEGIDTVSEAVVNPEALSFMHWEEFETVYESSTLLIGLMDAFSTVDLNQMIRYFPQGQLSLNGFKQFFSSTPPELLPEAAKEYIKNHYYRKALKSVDKIFKALPKDVNQKGIKVLFSKNESQMDQVHKFLSLNNAFEVDQVEGKIQQVHAAATGWEKGLKESLNRKDKYLNPESGNRAKALEVVKKEKEGYYTGLQSVTSQAVLFSAAVGLSQESVEKTVATLNGELPHNQRIEDEVKNLLVEIRTGNPDPVKIDYVCAKINGIQLLKYLYPGSVQSIIVEYVKYLRNSDQFTYSGSLKESILSMITSIGQALFKKDLDQLNGLSQIIEKVKTLDLAAASIQVESFRNSLPNELCELSPSELARIHKLGNLKRYLQDDMKEIKPDELELYLQKVERDKEVWRVEEGKKPKDLFNFITMRYLTHFEKMSDDEIEVLQDVFYQHILDFIEQSTFDSRNGGVDSKYLAAQFIATNVTGSLSLADMFVLRNTSKSAGRAVLDWFQSNEVHKIPSTPLVAISDQLSPIGASIIPHLLKIANHHYFSIVKFQPEKESLLYSYRGNVFPKSLYEVLPPGAERNDPVQDVAYCQKVISTFSSVWKAVLFPDEGMQLKRGRIAIAEVTDNIVKEVLNRSFTNLKISGQVASVPKDDFEAFKQFLILSLKDDYMGLKFYRYAANEVEEKILLDLFTKGELNLISGAISFEQFDKVLAVSKEHVANETDAIQTARLIYKRLISRRSIDSLSGTEYREKSEIYVHNLFLFTGLGSPSGIAPIVRIAFKNIWDNLSVSPQIPQQMQNGLLDYISSLRNEVLLGPPDQKDWEGIRTRIEAYSMANIASEAFEKTSEYRSTIAAIMYVRDVLQTNPYFKLVEIPDSLKRSVISSFSNVFPGLSNEFVFALASIIVLEGGDGLDVATNSYVQEFNPIIEVVQSINSLWRSLTTNVLTHEILTIDIRRTKVDELAEFSETISKVEDELAMIASMPMAESIFHQTSLWTRPPLDIREVFAEIESLNILFQSTNSNLTGLSIVPNIDAPASFRERLKRLILLLDSISPSQIGTPLLPTMLTTFDTSWFSRINELKHLLNSQLSHHPLLLPVGQLLAGDERERVLEVLGVILPSRLIDRIEPQTLLIDALATSDSPVGSNDLLSYKGVLTQVRIIQEKLRILATAVVEDNPVEVMKKEKKRKKNR